MRIARFVALILGAGVALVLLALVLVAVLFVPNNHKGELERLVRAQTGRELQLTGDLKLSLFPWLAVEFGPAALGNAPGFGAEPMVSVQRARLSLKVLPLLHGRLEIGAASLEQPTIRLGVDESGRDNWSDLGGESATHPAASAPTPGTAPALHSIGALALRGGTVLYSNRQHPSDWAIEDLAFSTGSIQPDAPTALKLSLSLRHGPAPALHLTLTTRATLNLAARHFTLQHSDIGLTLHASGLPDAGLVLNAQAAQIEADLNAQTLKASTLTLAAAGAQFSAELTGTQIVDAPTWSGSIRLAPVSPRSLLQGFGIAPPVTRDPKALQLLAFSADVQATPGAVSLQHLQLQLDTSHVQGSIGVADLAHEALRFELSLDQLDADRYLAPAAAPRGASAPARESATAASVLPVELIRSLNARGQLHIGNLTYGALPFSDVLVGIDAAGGELRLEPLSARLYGGQYHGTIRIDAAARVPHVTLDQHLSGVEFAPLFKTLLGTERFSGSGDALLQATADGRDSQALVASLNGKCGFEVHHGALEGMDLWFEIRRARALLKQEPLPSAAPGPSRTVFSALSGTGQIDHGIVRNRDLLVAMQSLQVRGQGTIDAAKGTLDFLLQAEVLKSAASADGASPLQDIEGLSIPVQLSGPLSAPRLRPDLAGLVRSQAQQRLDQKKQELEQKLKDRLQDKLKDLFGH